MRFETLNYAWDPGNPLSGEKPTIRGSVSARLSYLLHTATVVAPFTTDHLFLSTLTSV